MRFHCANNLLVLRSFALERQGRVQLVTLGWDISVVVSFIMASLLQEEMMYTSLLCCDKTMDDRMAIYREQ